jgi:hypothetical protein
MSGAAVLPVGQQPTLRRSALCIHSASRRPYTDQGDRRLDCTFAVIPAAAFGVPVREHTAGAAVPDHPYAAEALTIGIFAGRIPVSPKYGDTRRSSWLASVSVSSSGGNVQLGGRSAWFVAAQKRIAETIERTGRRRCPFCPATVLRFQHGSIPSPAQRLWTA